MVGVVDTHIALQRARDAGLDLVEISPETNPPVCKIIDYGKFKYEQNKKDKAGRSKTKGADLKEVRLGRSMKIDPHDIEIRVQQARRFLMEGHKVLIVQNFVGREMMHKERGYQRINDITQKLSDIAKIEVPPRMAGRRMSTIYAPDRVKIEQIKRREASRKTSDQAKASEPGPTEAASEAAPPAAPKPKMQDAKRTADAAAVSR
jgi:translation initiation factor IF-3